MKKSLSIFGLLLGLLALSLSTGGVLCAVPVRGQLDDPAVAQRIREHAAELATSCTPVRVGQAPAVQQAILQVEGPG